MARKAPRPGDLRRSDLDAALRVLYEPRVSGRADRRAWEKLQLLRSLPSGPGALEALIWACRHPEDMVRANAAWALGDLGDRRAYPHLAHLLRDPCRWPGRAAVRALGRLGETRATFAILNLYPHSQQHFRQEALEALGELRDPRSADFLRRIIATETTHLRERAAKALEQITSSEPPPYRYVGPPEAVSPPGMATLTLSLRGPRDLASLEGWTIREAPGGELGYVVGMDGAMTLWPESWGQAHAAPREDVLAAGTIRLAHRATWTAEELTNISFDYYPDNCSYRAARTALERVGVQVTGAAFTRRFPEDWPQYRCGYCDEPFLANQPFYGEAAGDALTREMAFADPGAWAR